MSEVREVTSLPLAGSTVELLQRHGFRFLDDLRQMKALDLSDELRVSPAQALEILQVVERAYSSSTAETQRSEETSLAGGTSSSSTTNSSGAASGGIGPSSLGVGDRRETEMTARDLMSKSLTQRALITFCKDIDSMLGGGVPCGQITEFCGVPGIGKTQISIQLACNVQIPTIFRGVDGQCLYIDTEGSFLPERAYEIAKELSNHLGKVAKANAQSKAGNTASTLLAAAQEMSPEHILEGIHYIRCHSQSELLATINNLPAFLKEKTAIKLIVIDSIAFHFRADVYDFTSRNRTLSGVAQLLNQVAFQHNLSVVVMNHVTSKLAKASGGIGYAGNATDNQLVLNPALGENWSHSITNRVLLHWKHNPGTSSSNMTRVATLMKSPSMPVKTVAYLVNHRGIRDVVIPSATSSSQSSTLTSSTDSDQNKRLRVM